MKKLAFVLSLVMVLGAFAGCSGQSAEVQTTAPAAAAEPDLQAVYDAMTAMENSPEMLPLEADMQFNFCGVDPADCEMSIVAICADSLRADEIWLIRAVDDAALERIQTAAQNRLTAKDEESITYSPEQNAIVKQAVTLTAGNYFMMVVSPEAEALADIFRAAAGI